MFYSSIQRIHIICKPYTFYTAMRECVTIGTVAPRSDMASLVLVLPDDVVYITIALAADAAIILGSLRLCSSLPSNDTA